MKVLEHGRIATCHSCGCRMQYEPSDVRHNPIYGTKARIGYIICPDCHAMIEVSHEV